MKAMIMKKGVAILIPSSRGASEEFIESELHRKITQKGFVTLIPNKTDSTGTSELIQDIVEILSAQKEDSTILFGASDAALTVISLMIEQHPSISAGIAVSPPFSEEFTHLLSRIEKPLLIVNGSDDDESSLRDGRKYHDLIEGSVLRVLRKTGHYPHIEKTERFFITLDKFLQDEL